MVPVLLVLLLTRVFSLSNAQFNPSVSVTCAVGPSYTVTLESGGSRTGIVYISGLCEPQATTRTGTYIFDDSTCTLTSAGAPDIGAVFHLVVLENDGPLLPSDLVIRVTCMVHNGTQTQLMDFSVAGEDYDEEDVAILVPNFRKRFRDSNNNIIKSARIGDNVRIDINIPNSEASTFDNLYFQVANVYITNADFTVAVVENGCSNYPDLFADPPSAAKDKIKLPHTVFIPKDTSTNPSLPGMADTDLAYALDINLCVGGCSPLSCVAGRRKRDKAPSTEKVKIQTLLMIKQNEKQVQFTSRKRSLDNESGVDVPVACFPRWSLALVSVLCAITMWLWIVVALWMVRKIVNQNPVAQRNLTDCLT